MMGRLVETLSA
ncbi:MAG: hypothetical protein KDK75_14055, partial [Alphaproteobacteria bacterium]|nr:hypothetical protein [Alphaproteobacteria bacterium]